MTGCPRVWETRRLCSPHLTFDKLEILLEQVERRSRSRTGVDKERRNEHLCLRQNWGLDAKLWHL